MDEFEFDNNNANAAEINIELIDNDLNVKVTILNSVASEVTDAFTNKEASEKQVIIGGKPLPIGDFIVSLLKENKFDNVMMILGMIQSQKSSLKEGNFSDTEKYEYIPKAARVKVVGLVEVDITNSGPAAMVAYVGNGELVICNDTVNSAVFYGKFLLGNLLADPVPYSGVTTKRLKTLAADDVIKIKAFKARREFEIPAHTMKYLWEVLTKKAGGKNANGQIGNIPWIVDGEKPVALQTALSTIFTSLLSAVHGMRSDEIEYKGQKLKAWKFVSAWFEQKLCNEKDPVYTNWGTIISHLHKFEWNVAVTPTQIGQLPILATFAGKYLEGCRAVRGRDNPGLEYGPWTLAENIPWGIMGLIKNRSFCESKIDMIGPIECVIKSSNIDNSFVSSKTVNGLIKGWEEGVTATTGSIFIYGEDLESSGFFGVAVERTPDLDKVAPIWLMSYVMGKTNFKRTIVVRFLLPQGAGPYDKFLSLCKEMIKKGGLYLFPSLTPHNMEGFLIFIPGVATDTAALRDNVLVQMHHMYKASIICNFARTVSYCLMLPGNLGKAMFYSKTMLEWIKYATGCFSGKFFIDKLVRTPVYQRTTLDDGEVVYNPIGKEVETDFSEKRRKTATGVEKKIAINRNDHNVNAQHQDNSMESEHS